MHNGELPFRAVVTTKNSHSIRPLSLASVFSEAVAALIRNKQLIANMKFIDLVLPGLDDLLRTP